ncbi:MAG TPA: hypothetical protein VHK70_01100 [Burkholderiaceae bacterium]|jgi:hypothetical protein|nr:hypothetical protein [Burkholderiaceae bacterium]
MMPAFLRPKARILDYHKTRHTELPGETPLAKNTPVHVVTYGTHREIADGAAFNRSNVNEQVGADKDLPSMADEAIEAARHA